MLVIRDLTNGDTSKLFFIVKKWIFQFLELSMAKSGLELMSYPFTLLI